MKFMKNLSLGVLVSLVAIGTPLAIIYTSGVQANKKTQHSTNVEAMSLTELY